MGPGTFKAGGKERSSAGESEVSAAGAAIHRGGEWRWPEGPSAYKEKGRFFGAVRGLSDKKLRLGVDFWCDYYIMVEECNDSEGSILPGLL